MVGISADDLSTQQRFSESFGDGLQFPLIADSTCEVMSAYGSKMPDADMSNRMTFVVDRNARIAYVNPDVDARSDAQYAALVESVSALAGG